MKFYTMAVNSTCLLLIGAITSSSNVVDGHFVWADTDTETQMVFVEFSEKAGVADKLIRILPSLRMQYIDATNKASHNDEDDIPLNLSEDKSLLEGCLPRHGQGTRHDGLPAYVYGTLDYGKFQDFHDLLYPFAAQIYESEDDYEGFFRPLMRKIKSPAIVMTNCGTSDDDGKTDRHGLDIGGFPEGPVDVCIYKKGGLEIGCGSFVSSGDVVPTTTEQQEQQEFGQEETITSIDRRQLRRHQDDSIISTNKSLVLSIDSMLGQQLGSTTSSPVLIYALANSTTIDKETGETNIIFASTSVYFQGPCTKV